MIHQNKEAVVLFSRDEKWYYHDVIVNKAITIFAAIRIGNGLGV